jgi:type I restriction enzyme S subunit
MTSSNGHHVAPALPIGWVACHLAEAVTPGRPRGNPVDFAGQPFIGLEHIEAHTTRILGFVPAETMRSSGVQFSAGDVLYGRMRPYLNKVWLADRDGLCSGEFIVFPKTGALRGAFLKYRLNAQDFVTFTDHATTGDRPRADFADFGKFPVLVPPLAEQTRIADRIDELFTDLAAGVAALERVKRNLSRYRAAVLHAAVTGRLTEAWRKQHGPPDEPGPKLLERILAERRRQWEERTRAKYEKDGRPLPKKWRERYPEPSPPKLPADGSPLPELPKGWCLASVDQVTQIIQYGTSAKTNEDACGVPVLRMGNITTEGTVDYANLKYLPHNHDEFPELLLERGDILFNRTNSAELVGKTAVFEPPTPGPYSLASYLIRVRMVEGCSPWWLTWCVISPLGRRWLRGVLSHTAGQANVNGTKLAEYTIPLPPLAEQAAIVEAVNEKLSQIDGLESEIECGLARASRLRQSILKAAFEGRLVPQDPADEPASVLLERIRQQAADPSSPPVARRTKTVRAAENGSGRAKTPKKVLKS